jgi:hypothetical protein
LRGYAFDKAPAYTHTVGRYAFDKASACSVTRRGYAFLKGSACNLALHLALERKVWLLRKNMISSIKGGGCH